MTKRIMIIWTMKKINITNGCHGKIEKKDVDYIVR
jgi:hypothetical protein